MKRCILCCLVLPQKNKPEHVLLNALGGRKTVSSIICSTCNSEMGSGPDRRLAKSVSDIRCLAGFSAGDGDRPPKIRNAGTADIPYELVDGTPVAKIADPLQIQESGKNPTKIFIQANSDTKLYKLFDAVMKKYNLSEEKTKENREIFRQSIVKKHIPLPTFHLDLSLGDTFSLRSMAKSLLVLWADKIGNDEISDSRYDVIRRYVTHGPEEIPSFIHAKSSTPPKEVFEFGETPNFIWVGSDVAGYVWGYFGLYGVIGWSFKLCENSPYTQVTHAMISDPSKNAHWECTERIGNFLDTEWVKSTECNTKELNRNFLRLRQKFMQRSEELAFSKAFTETMQELKISYGDTLNEKLMKAFADRIAYKALFSLFRLPWEQAGSD